MLSGHETLVMEKARRHPRENNKINRWNPKLLRLWNRLRPIGDRNMKCFSQEGGLKKDRWNPDRLPVPTGND